MTVYRLARRVDHRLPGGVVAAEAVQQQHDRARPGLHEGAAVAVDRDVLDLVRAFRTRGLLVRVVGVDDAIQPEPVRSGRRIPCLTGYSPISPRPERRPLAVDPCPRRAADAAPARAADAALQRATGALSTAAMARMETDMPWFRELSAEDRSWVGLIVQAGIRGFVDWYRHEGDRPDSGSAPGRLRLRRRAAGPGRRHQPPADRRPGPALASRSSRATSTSCSTPPTPPTCTPRCSATPARSRSPPPRSTPAPPRSAAPGTPGSRRWSSTRCCAPRPTRPCSRAPARSAGAAAATSPSCWAPSPRGARETDIFDEVRRGARGRRAWTRSARCRATGWWSCSAGSTDAGEARRGGRRPVRRRPGRGRPGRRATSASAHVSARAALSAAPGRGGLAGGAPAGAQQRPAARAGAGRRRPRPPPPGRGGLPAAGRRPRHPDRDARGVLPARLVDRGHRRAPSSCTPTPCATACARSPTLTGFSPVRRPRRVHPRDRPGAGSPVGPRRASDALCRVPTKIAAADFVRAGGERGPPDTAELGTCSSSSLPAKAPRPPASSRPGSRTRRSPRASTGSPPSPASTWPTTAPRPTPRRSATPRSPSRCWSPPAWSRPSSCSRTRPTRSSRSARSPGHSVGELAAAAGARAITAEQAMVLVRERGKAMAEAAAVTPTGMTAVLGGDREEVLAALDEHGLTPGQRQRPRPDRRRRHPRAARGARRRPAGQGAADPAERRRRLPHRAHGPRGRPPRRPRRARSRCTTRAPR